MARGYEIPIDTDALERQIEKFDRLATLLDEIARLSADPTVARVLRDLQVEV